MNSRFQPTHLILVPGHAPLNNLDGDVHDDDSWILEPFQRDSHHVDLFLGHLWAAFNELRKDLANSVLVTSGGDTRDDGPGLTESESYIQAAVKAGIVDRNEFEILNDTPRASRDRSEQKLHLMCETRAKDSPENLLYSLAIFEARFGYLPSVTTVFAFRFKQARYEASWNALKIPGEFCYRGVNDPPPGQREKALVAEKKLIGKFADDPMGVCDPDLITKRNARDPRSRNSPESYVNKVGNERLRELLAENFESYRPRKPR